MFHGVLQMDDSVLFYEMSYGDNFCEVKIISELQNNGCTWERGVITQAEIQILALVTMNLIPYSLVAH
jgi:hypothetical protein